MKQLIIRLPQKVAYQFKIVCATLDISAQKVLEKMVQEFLKENTGNKSPHPRKDHGI